MARTVKSDPLRNFKFGVTIHPISGGKLEDVLGGSVKLGFSVVSGLTVQNEMIAYREGGMNTHPHKMVGQSDFGPVTFTRGMYADESKLYKWQTFMHTWAAGADNAFGASDGDNDYRCDIDIRVYDHPVADRGYAMANEPDSGATFDVKLAYRLHNAWPASFSTGDLNAGDSSILIQQMVVNHEGFSIPNWGQLPALA